MMGEHEIQQQFPSIECTFQEPIVCWYREILTWQYYWIEICNHFKYTLGSC